jgi:hypothetical protein
LIAEAVLLYTRLVLWVGMVLGLLFVDSMPGAGSVAALSFLAFSLSHAFLLGPL